MDDSSFTANGHMDDIIYQQECAHHTHKTSSSATWKYHDWDHRTLVCGHTSNLEKENLDSHFFEVNVGGVPELFCLDDCHDPSCDEPPCTECDEDVVVCTNAACSPPPDQGTCDAVAIGNTSCAGEVPYDVLRGASALNVLLQLSSNENAQAQHHSFGFNHPTHSGCFLDHDQSFGQDYYFDAFGNTNSDGFHAITNQSFCSSHELTNVGDAYLAQSYNLGSQGVIPMQIQQRILPHESSMRTSYSTSIQEMSNSIPCASVSSESSPFSPTTQHAYTSSHDSTPSTGTPYQEALQQSYAYHPNAPYTSSSSDQSESICLFYSNGEECGQVFNNTADLLRHVKALHETKIEKSNGYVPIESTMESPVESVDSICRWMTNNKQCGHVFDTPEQLQNHIQEWHTATLKKADGFICRWSECVRQQTQPDKAGFAQRSKLDRHIQSHTGYKACTCERILLDGSRCGKLFSTQQSLTLHERTHTGERPHKCEHCGYAAAQASQLTMHVRTRHTKVKPLVCPFPGCGASFSESSNLSKHKKIHQPGENCPCPMCDRVFRRPDQLKRHMNTTHKTAAARVQNRRSISKSVPTALESLSLRWEG